MNKKYIILLTFIIGIGSLNAQSLKRFKLQASEAFEAKDFSRALEYYQMIINDAEDETSENYYNAAESAREFRVYHLAEQYYRQVLTDSIARSTYRLSNFHLGSVLKYQGRYDEAKSYFQKFLSENASFVSEKYTGKAQKEISDCDWAKTLVDSGIPIIQLDSTVNTPNSEFSPILLGDELYFSSVRYSTGPDNLPKDPLTRIYVSKESKLGQQVTEDFNEDLMHSAHATFNQDASRIYYTVCSSVNATEVNCKIYYREKNEDDKWGKRVVLSNTINKEGYTATQPSVGFDEKTGKEVIFFVSDRPTDDSDTEKDLNIWCSFRDGDYFGDAGPITDLNTEGDDVTPFFHTASQKIYFSSNGRQNMGGLDVYTSDRSSQGWGTVEHMAVPLNSSYDDVYYSLNTDGTTAYLSSNRSGATCDSEDEDCACNDIYEIPQIKIKVLTYNSITGEPLYGTTVTLEELKSQLSRPQSKDKSNEYDYSGSFNIEYKVDAQLEGWVFDDSLFNTINIKGGTLVEIPLYLTPAVDLDALTFSKATNAPLAGVNVELVEIKDDPFFEGEVKPKYGANSVKYNYPIDYKKRYMVVGSKFGYSRDSFIVSTENIPVEPWHLADSLYLCKIPPELTKLYFYNDEPNRRTRRSETDWNYTKAYDLLTADAMRDSFNRELNSEPVERGKILRFFKEAEDGMVILDSFTNLLLNDPSYLGEGDAKVIVRGFASPRAKNNYNLKLTDRRINSIRNYFEEKGLLQMYPGRIIFESKPNGEETAKDKGISDDINDRAKSIYYDGPSRERRVEIEWILNVPDACPENEQSEETDNSKY